MFQFFVTLANTLDYLDGKHTVFGEVSEGFDVIDKLNEAICDENDRPYQDIRCVLRCNTDLPSLTVSWSLFGILKSHGFAPEE